MPKDGFENIYENFNFEENGLASFFLKQKDDLIFLWVDLVNRTYPLQTTGFLRTYKNEFTNPVGHRTQQAAEVFFEELFLNYFNKDNIKKVIDDFVHVRAVQGFSSEAAINIIFSIKNIVRQKAFENNFIPKYFQELLIIESRIDDLALIAFDCYVNCKEKLYEMKMDSFKRKHSQIIRLAQRFNGQSFEEAEEDSNQ